jgi:hypothetical protein
MTYTRPQLLAGLHRLMALFWQYFLGTDYPAARMARQISRFESGLLAWLIQEARALIDRTPDPIANARSRAHTEPRETQKPAPARQQNHLRGRTFGFRTLMAPIRPNRLDRAASAASGWLRRTDKDQALLARLERAYHVLETPEPAILYVARKLRALGFRSGENRPQRSERAFHPYTDEASDSRASIAPESAHASGPAPDT